MEKPRRAFKRPSGRDRNKPVFFGKRSKYPKIREERRQGSSKKEQRKVERVLQEGTRGGCKIRKKTEKTHSHTRFVRGSAVAAEGDADGPQLPGHAGAHLIIMCEVVLFGLALFPLPGLEFPPVSTGFVAAGEVGGTVGLTGQHGGPLLPMTRYRTGTSIVRPGEPMPPKERKMWVKISYSRNRNACFTRCIVVSYRQSWGKMVPNFSEAHKYCLLISAFYTLEERDMRSIM